MLTLYELFLSSYPDQKEMQISLNKNKVTIFWLDIRRIIKPELLFCCANMWLSILLGYAEVWELSEDQHSWRSQNTIKVWSLKAQADSTELYWTSQQCSFSAEITLEQSCVELHPECCSLPLLFSTPVYCPYTLSTTNGFITEAPEHNSNTN